MPCLMSRCCSMDYRLCQDFHGHFWCCWQGHTSITGRVVLHGLRIQQASIFEILVRLPNRIGLNLDHRMLWDMSPLTLINLLLIASWTSGIAGYLATYNSTQHPKKLSPSPSPTGPDDCSLHNFGEKLCQSSHKESFPRSNHKEAFPSCCYFILKVTCNRGYFQWCAS